MKGKQIRNLRQRLHWSQQQLADYLGYGDRGAVSNIENGKREASEAKRRLLELLRLYRGDAPGLWDRDKAKRIKRILKENDDE